MSTLLQRQRYIQPPMVAVSSLTPCLQTYYLTIDLSHEGLKKPPTKMMPHSRSGYFKHWQDQHTLDRDARTTKQTPNQEQENDDGARAGDDEDEDEDEVKNEDDGDKNNNNDEVTVEAENQNDEDILLDPALRSETAAMEKKANEEARRKAKGKGPAIPRDNPTPIEVDDVEQTESSKQERTGSNSIQILELHSDNPVISYRGRVFEAEWAEVIGTEMLFTTRSEKQPLPALRQLAGDIDLLAASCARLITKEKKVKPRRTAQDTLAPVRKEYGIHIPVGKNRSGERAAQARFLENLMALKKLRGETDEVTVYAQPGTGKDFDDNKLPDSRPRRRRPPTSGDVSGRGRASPHTASRGRVAARGGSRAASTPTPSHWEDLTRTDNNDTGDDNEEEEEDEEEDEDEDDDDDVLMED